MPVAVTQGPQHDRVRAAVVLAGHVLQARMGDRGRPACLFGAARAPLQRGVSVVLQTAEFADLQRQCGVGACIVEDLAWVEQQAPEILMPSTTAWVKGAYSPPGLPSKARRGCCR